MSLFFIANPHLQSSLKFLCTSKSHFPLSLTFQNNNIQTMHEDTFCNSQDQSHIRRALEDIRLDGNPINLSLFPNAYFCLPRLPTGRFL